MSDYNVNMKKFNGTDYDNILPMSYLAKIAEKLGDGATSDIINQARDGLAQISAGTYAGNGTVTSPTKINVGFKPKFLFIAPSFPVFKRTGELVSGVVLESISTGRSIPNKNFFTGLLVVDGVPNLLYFSDDSGGQHIRTVEITEKDGEVFIQQYGYTAEYKNGTYVLKSGLQSDPVYQFNGQGIYYWVAIGNSSLFSVTDWLISGAGLLVGSSPKITSWTAPYSRKYYIELYGWGGFGGNPPGDKYYQGRSSCQSYTLSLQKGTSFSISLPPPSNNPSQTTFGEYSVASGESARFISNQGMVARKGSGNLGTDGTMVESPTNNYSKGFYSKSFGWGGCNIDGVAGPSGIYIKYLKS